MGNLLGSLLENSEAWSQAEPFWRFTKRLNNVQFTPRCVLRGSACRACPPHLSLIAVTSFPAFHVPPEQACHVGGSG
jgi:hypothetical protein